MPFVEAHPHIQDPFRLTEDRQVHLENTLRTEVSDALSVRREQERHWMEAARLYAGRSVNSMRSFPIEAPNVELTIGGSAVDAINAQTIDTLWRPKPSLAIRPTYGSTWVEHAADLQRFSQHVIHTEAHMRDASNHATLSCIKYGTAYLYTPYVERTWNTLTARIVERGPRTFSLPLEDVIVPGGVMDFWDTPWVALRFWWSAPEFHERARMRGWNTDNAQTTANLSTFRAYRERVAATQPSFTNRTDVFQIAAIFGRFDVDDDNNAKDLLVYYDMTSGKVLQATWNPYTRIPIDKAVYQLRDHLFYGIGVMDMIVPYQVAASEFLNEWLMNARLANMRGFIGPPNQIPGDTVRLWSGRYIGLPNHEKVKEFALADVYNSIPQAIGLLTSFAERRVGVNEVSSPKGSNTFGNRTPGITALTMMQAVNRRYTSAYDSMRTMHGGAAMNALFRYHERIRSSDRRAFDRIQEIMGDDAGRRVVEILSQPDFDQQIQVEMAATSTTENDLQERQDAVALAGFLGEYYDKIVAATATASQQGIPEPVRQIALRVANAMNEVVERTVRKFDQVRDPESFIIEMEDVIQSIPGVQQQPSGGNDILGLIGSLNGQNGGPQQGGAGVLGGGALQ